MANSTQVETTLAMLRALFRQLFYIPAWISLSLPTLLPSYSNDATTTTTTTLYAKTTGEG